MTQNEAHYLVYCTCPERGIAEQLAHQLVEEKLAACVNIIPDIQSIYTWENKVESTNECLLLIKTTQSIYALIESRIQQEHPYDCPEIIATPIERGLPEYLNWLSQSVRS